MLCECKHTILLGVNTSNVIANKQTKRNLYLVGTDTRGVNKLCYKLPIFFIISDIQVIVFFSLIRCHDISSTFYKCQ